MNSTYTTPYARVTTDRNGERLTLGDQAVIHRDGHYLLGPVVDIRDAVGLGDIVTIETRAGERVSACHSVVARTRRQTIRRKAA